MRFGPELEALGVRDGDRTFARHMGDLPTFKGYRRGKGSAVKLSDFVTSRQFQQTGLYNEFYRPVHIQHHMSKGLPGPPGLVTAITLHRQRPDFSERDRLLLTLLRPHLNQAYRNAEAVDAMRRELTALRNGVESLDQGLVILDRDDRVVTMTARAHRLFEEYFEPLPAPGLPAAVARWLRHVTRSPAADEAPSPRTPLTVELDDRQLEVRPIAMDDQTLLALIQRQTKPRPEALEPLGLTRRESEVLAWIAEGKTNAEIGIILSASLRTIQKHVERVLGKLGVETRTAAAARALSLLRA